MEEMGEADKALPVDVRICVRGMGEGSYVSFTRRMIGSNEHTIEFDSGETVPVKLKEVEWTVRKSEMAAMAAERESDPDPEPEPKAAASGDGDQTPCEEGMVECQF
eukprot:COSAG04_NODE_9371_length_870_cov_0.638132_1_plen_105_part_10